MRPVDILGLAAAIVISLLMLIVEPWSGPWWIGLLAASFVALSAVLHIALGGNARRIARISAGAFILIGGPIFGLWYWWNYPASLSLVQARFPVLYAPPPIKTPPVPLVPKTLEATVGKAYYKCRTNGASPTPEQAAKEKTDFQLYITAWANLYGFKPPQLTEVPGGYKAELVPNSFSEPMKRTFQIVRVGKELIGFYSADYMYPTTGNEPLTPNSPLEAYIRKPIEDLAKVEPGECKLQ
jgi:hypothetical protein